jgi:ammonia channel protein AmtB
MPLPSPPRVRPATRRTHRTLVLAGVVLLAVLAAAVAWAAFNPGSNGSSKAGCITVTLPSSTGGALMHACGARAKAMCRDAFAREDRISLLTRPQCRLAGLASAP